MVAAAVIGGAVVGAAGSAYAGDKAADATKKGTKSAVAEQRAAREQSERLSAPYRALGESALPQLKDLLGLGERGMAGIRDTLSALPGYQFAREQGIEGTARAAAAKGFNLSGNQLTAIQDYGTNLADMTYGEQINRLLAPVSMGQAAAAGQAANGMGVANNISSLQQNQGNQLAGIEANKVAGIAGAATNAGNQWITQRTLDGLNSPGPTQAPTTAPTYADRAVSAGYG